MATVNIISNQSYGNKQYKLVGGRYMSVGSTKLLVNINISFKFKDGRLAIYLRT